MYQGPLDDLSIKLVAGFRIISSLNRARSAIVGFKSITVVRIPLSSEMHAKDKMNEVKGPENQCTYFVVPLRIPFHSQRRGWCPYG